MYASKIFLAILHSIPGNGNLFHLLHVKFIKRLSEYFLFLQTALTTILGVVAAIQTVVIMYGLEKFYSTWSRSWVVVKGIFNLLKRKLKKEKKVEEKAKNIELKIRKSSLKRWGIL